MSMWGVGATVLLDKNNKFYPFPHERPRVPDYAVKETYDALAADTKLWNNTEFQKRIIIRFAQLVRDFDTAGGLPDPFSKEAHEISFWLMMVTRISKQRFWLITSNLINDQTVVLFRPVSALSPTDAKHKIERLIARIVAEPHDQSQLNSTVH